MGIMKQKRVIPLRFQVEIEERLGVPAVRRWRAQFRFYPLGYFRGRSNCPGRALGIAWRKFRRQVDPKGRWWTAILDPPLPKF